jgi:very-short-patch-repair endonuclease
MRFLPEDDPRRKVWARCESPIELWLCCALFAQLGCKAVVGPFHPSRGPELGKIAGEQPASFLFAQHRVGVYRTDFLLVVVDPTRRTFKHIVIECDGAGWHTSDQQVARDEHRDAYMVKAGYRVIRYTGARLYSEMPEVLGEIRQWIEDAGAICKTGDDMAWFAGLLGVYTPSHKTREQYFERQRLRSKALHEEDMEARANEPDFISDEGMSGRWADTL